MEWYHVVEMVGAIVLTFIVGYGFGSVNMKKKIIDILPNINDLETTSILKKKLKL